MLAAPSACQREAMGQSAARLSHFGGSRDSSPPAPTAMKTRVAQESLVVARLLSNVAAVCEALAGAEWGDSTLDLVAAILVDRSGVSSCAVYLAAEDGRPRLAASRRWNESDDKGCQNLLRRTPRARSVRHGAIIAPLLAGGAWLGALALRFEGQAVQARAQRAFAEAIAAQLACAEASRASREAVELEVSRLRSHFLAEMSHELRTPLNTILGFSELLERESLGPLLPRQKEYLGYVLRGGQRLLGFIDKMTDENRSRD